MMPGSELRHLKAIEKKLLWLSCWTVHNANHLRDKDRWAEGRRPSGLIRVDGLDYDGALFPYAAPPTPISCTR